MKWAFFLWTVTIPPPRTWEDPPKNLPLSGAPPRWSPADIAYHLKKATGQEVLAEFPALRQQFRKSTLWARGYFVSTVGEDRVSDQIRAYIRKQGQLAPLEPVRQSDQLSLF